MNVFVTTLGCRLNEAEVASWSRSFARGGHRVVTDVAEADVAVVNTCAVTGEATRKSRKLVSRLHRKNPQARVVVCGCFAELQRDIVTALPGVDLVVSNQDKDELAKRVMDAFARKSESESVSESESESESESVTVSESESVSESVLAARSKTRAFIKCQDGCRNKCSFCIVTVARGQERSRSISDLIAEINMLAATGTQEVVLTGVHLGGYGSDLSTDLVALVEAIGSDTDIPRVRLSSLEPWDLPPDFGRLWNNPRLMPHLHLPLQSGCDSVLRRMSRRCMTSEFDKLVAGLRHEVPDLAITTDIIVGFPGETNDEWRRTLEFVAEVGFSDMHIFRYSPREGTRAATLPDPVAPDMQAQRSREMHQLAETMRDDFLTASIGQARPVLWERVQRGPRGMELTARTTTSISGYTDNYLRVAAEVPEGTDNHWLNRIDNVLLVSVAGDRVVGTPIDTIAPAATSLGMRKRLPVLASHS